MSDNRTHAHTALDPDGRFREFSTPAAIVRAAAYGTCDIAERARALIDGEALSWQDEGFIEEWNSFVFQAYLSETLLPIAVTLDAMSDPATLRAFREVRAPHAVRSIDEASRSHCAARTHA